MADMINKRKIKQELMAWDFILTELGLYLNSHPNDKNALRMHNEASKNAMDMRKKYSEMYGPLTSADNGDKAWEWVKGPWPWENE